MEAMSRPIIDTDTCIGCGICVDACPQEVLEIGDGVAEVVNEEACIACGNCLDECAMGAITEISED
jgi:NAD-dependent dihydropyrimidine dehydrogenase PreA subunit